MNLIVDADACPSIKLITNKAKEYKIDLILYSDYTHDLKNEYGKIITVSKGFQSVDMVISNNIEKDDILITQDFGLATIGLSKGAHVIHPKGMIYSDENIDGLLFERHLNNKERKNRNHIKGPKKRTKEDDNRLLYSIDSIIRSFYEEFKGKEK